MYREKLGTPAQPQHNARSVIVEGDDKRRDHGDQQQQLDVLRGGCLRTAGRVGRTFYRPPFIDQAASPRPFL